MLLLSFLLQIDIVPELRSAPSLYEDWMLLLFALVFIHIAYVRISYQRRLQRLFSSLLRLQILRQLMREELVFSHRASVLLFANFVLLLSLVFYLTAKFFEWSLPYGYGWLSYLVVVASIALLYFSKLMLGRFMRWLFKDGSVIREYLFELFLVNKALGLLLIPVCLAMAYTSAGSVILLLWLAAFLAAGSFLFRILQGLRISRSHRAHGVYIFLYLCTLEILPVLVIAEYINRRFL